jgi:hypothetical protein
MATGRMARICSPQTADDAVPGAPPLGVRGDIAVFLWAEIACVVCLLSFIVIWARHRPA